MIRNAKAMEQDMIARAATQPPVRHLRIPSRDARRRERERFEADLVLVREAMAGLEKSIHMRGDA